MHELRQDPISGRWVIVAANRSERPQQFKPPRIEASGSPCPFCEGNERETPHEVLALRSRCSATDGAGWQVRVVPNRYPALVQDAGPFEPAIESQGLRRAASGYGIHEVIIESPQHLTSLTQLDDEAVADVLEVYAQRLAHHRQRGLGKYCQVFRNSGAAAGASIEHVHSQLMVLPFVPPTVATELDGARNYFTGHDACYYCAMIEQEITAQQRLVEMTDDFAVICPFASRCAYETWILPRWHACHFDELEWEQRESLAALLRSVLTRLESVLDPVAYNYFLHTTPFDTSGLAHYHWHIEILPRQATLAGFEWATGCYINHVPPEDAARRLRRQAGD